MSGSFEQVVSEMLNGVEAVWTLRLFRWTNVVNVDQMLKAFKDGAY